MRRWGVYLMILLLFLASCGEEKPDPVRFYLQAKGFILEAAFLDELPEFKHHLAGGVLRFSDASGEVLVDARANGLEHAEIELLPGTYSLSMELLDASIYGQEGASYELLTKELRVKSDSDTLIVEVRPTCSMVLVRDVQGHLNKVPHVIERHSFAPGYFISYPFAEGPTPGYYYTYLTPDPVWEDPSAFLWFLNDDPGQTLGGLSTSGMHTGMLYLIEIME